MRCLKSPCSAFAEILRRASKLIGLAALFALAGCCAEPSDFVSISIKSPPQPFQFLFLVAETEQGIQGVSWYGKETEWGALRPSTCWTNALRDFSGPGPHQLDDPVRWPKAQKYGVVIRLPDHGWRVWWFDESEVPLQDVSAICGGGHAVFDLSPPRQPAEVSPATVGDWGIRSSWLDEYIEPRIREWRKSLTAEPK